MNIVELKFEVHGTAPEWAVTSIERGVLQCPSYRLYLNNELLTERTWIWDNRTYIDEKIIVNIPTDTLHTLKIESIAKDLSQISFQGRLKSNGQINDITYITESNVSFRL
jgi:hypothetical protein